MFHATSGLTQLGGRLWHRIAGQVLESAAALVLASVQIGMLAFGVEDLSGYSFMQQRKQLALGNAMIAG